MRRRPGYKFAVWLMVLSGLVLAITVAFTSIKVIRSGKAFHETILEENKAFLVNTLRFGHGVMAHMGAEDYGGLIDLALKSEFIRYLAILDGSGGLIAESQPVKAFGSMGDADPRGFKDGAIVRQDGGLVLISYRAGAVSTTQAHRRHHETFGGPMREARAPAWFLVALDTADFQEHNRDMLIQSMGAGIAFLLLGLVLIVFFGIVQRYELASASLERLNKIKRVMGNFVPSIAKSLIETDPEKAILDRYVQDASVLFLDIEGFSNLTQQYSHEKISRGIEAYFSAFFDVIQSNGGDINETAGDGIMAIFPQPEPRQNALGAVQAAIKIREKCSEVSGRSESIPFPIQVNIGVSSGEVYLGSTKMRGMDEERWTFTASGRVTILAARLSDYGRGGQILLSEETARRIEPKIPLVPLGKVPLKNIEDSGEIYQISAEKSG